MLLQAHFVATFDYIPIPTKTELDGNILTLKKDGNESSYIDVTWPVAGRGLIRFRTSTLIMNRQPYYLLQELCRGKLNQLRMRIAEWNGPGFNLDPNIPTQLKQLVRQFNSSIDDPLSEASIEKVTHTLNDAVELGDRLLHQASQAWQTKKGARQSNCRVELITDAIPEATWLDTIGKTVTALRIIPAWSRIEPTEYGYNWLEFDRLLEWAESTGLPLSIGPLIDFKAEEFPNWMAQWSGDLPSLAAYTCDFVQTIIRRHQSIRATWHIFQGMNHVDRLEMNEDARLQMAARLLEAARQILPLGEWVIGIDQPWGDYLLQDEYTYSPLIFVDTLVRAGYYFNELSIAIDESLVPDQRDSRTAFDFIELIDRFRQIGASIKLTVIKSPIVPSSTLETDTQTMTLKNVELIHKLSNAIPAVETICLHASAMSNPSSIIEMLNRQKTAHDD